MESTYYLVFLYRRDQNTDMIVQYTQGVELSCWYMA